MSLTSGMCNSTAQKCLRALTTEAKELGARLVPKKAATQPLAFKKCATPVKSAREACGDTDPNLVVRKGSV